MKYEVYCRLDIEEYIEVDAEDEDEAKTIFSENIALCNRHWKEVESEVISKEE